MRLNSKQICEYTGGITLVEPIDASRLACGITWNSREVKEGDVYVALPGERVDGHSFVGDTLKAGAIIALVMDKPDEETCLLAREMGAAVIEVPNTTAALTDLAGAWRKRLGCHVVGLTGSSGKTTTKNLVRDVLQASFSVVATEGSQNNELGVPKTLLTADPDTEVIVVEMGMRGKGQITELCDFVKPDMGLITNIGDGHIELLGNRENVAAAKAELMEALPDGIGKAFLNLDDGYTEFIRTSTRLVERHVELVYFDGACGHAAAQAAEGLQGGEGLSPGARMGAWADAIRLGAEGRPVFDLHIDGQTRSITLPLLGLHNIHNACAAASIGAALGMDIDTIVHALGQTVPECGRQEVLRGRDGFLVINDAYNANPDSMRASLMTFSALKVQGERYAVLGDMGELGDIAEACHEGIGKLVAGLDIDYLYCIGDLSSHIADAARRGGMPADRVRQLDSVAEILGELDCAVTPKDAVLVKASHFMGLERVVGGLVS